MMLGTMTDVGSLLRPRVTIFNLFQQLNMCAVKKRHVISMIILKYKLMC